MCLSSQNIKNQGKEDLKCRFFKNLNLTSMSAFHILTFKTFILKDLKEKKD